MAKKQQAPEIQAVQMDSQRAPEVFGPNDPRAGEYVFGEVYKVGEGTMTAEKAQALVDGGGYEPAPAEKED